MRALVIQTSFLGDTVLTTPLLGYLAARGAVDVLVTPASAALLANNPDVGETIVFDKRAADRGAAGFLRLAAQLRARDYDVAYLAQGSLRSGALALASRIPRRVGFVTSSGRPFYTHRVPAPDNDHHAARLLRLAMWERGAEPSEEMLQPRLFPGEAERSAVDALFLERGWSGESFVTLAPGSVWATKRWPFYAELARLLAAEAPLVVVGSSADTPLAQEIIAAAGDRVLDATGRLTLLGSAELIGRATALVTNDSAPQHLASAMGTPTVAIFGPTVPEFGFGPLAPKAVVAGRRDLPCRPCDRHGPKQCPLRHWRCMREITPEHVAELLHHLLPVRPGVPPSL